ncbi:MAG: ATP-dependent Clp protease proteolytic subunit [Bacillales bacterium]|nr:ATP-dependent Clp protease proteolytic subunit [Bacillales bacterium]
MNYIPSVTIPGKDENKVYDLFSMLLSERIIFINGEIDSSLASVVVSEIIYLSAASKKEKITIYINSPGGEVNAGLAIYDAMKASPCPIETIGSGLCASMGALLLSSGDKGLRKAYPNCEIMIHQPLGGTNGQVSDIEIMTKRFAYIKEQITKILSKNTSQPIKKIEKDCDRNFFLTSNEALEYHLIDEIVETISSKE